jgi:Arc/MetJ family transcription regulator
MRTTIEIDDALFEAAQAQVHAPTKRALIEEALRALLREKAIEKLVEAGGSMGKAAAPKRRVGS